MDARTSVTLAYYSIVASGLLYERRRAKRSPVAQTPPFRASPSELSPTGALPHVSFFLRIQPIAGRRDGRSRL